MNGKKDREREREYQVLSESKFHLREESVVSMVVLLSLAAKPQPSSLRTAKFVILLFFLLLYVSSVP